MPLNSINSQILINPVVVNNKIITKTLSSKNPKIKKLEKSENLTKEDEDSEKSKEKQRSKSLIDVTI